MKFRYAGTAVRGALSVSLLLGVTAIAPTDSAVAAEKVADQDKSSRVDVPPGRALTPPGMSSDRVPGEVLVRFEPGVPAADRAAVRAGLGAKLVDKLPLRGLELLRVPEKRAESAIAALSLKGEVAYAEPNYLHQLSAKPDDPRFGQLWGLNNNGQSVGGQDGVADADIDAPEAWDSVTGDPSVTVAVVDTGVASGHPELAPNMWRNVDETANGFDDDGNGYVDDLHGWDWIDQDNSPADLNGHGTHVAGTIGAAGNNGSGIVGMAWKSSIMPLRVLDASGSGSTAEIISAFAYAAANGADVVNASLGGPGYSQALADTISQSSDTLFVVAAGNNSSNNETAATYPCNYPAENLVCVAATDNTDRLASFSNYGTTNVDLAAPGVGIVSTLPAQSTAFSDNFYSGSLGDKWVSGGGTGFNYWNVTSSSWYGPYATDSPWGNYAASANTWLRTAEPLDLGEKANCNLSFWLSMQTEENYDFFTVEGSRDGSTWQEIAHASGLWDGWHSVTQPLTAFDGDSSVYLRFRLQSDTTIQYDGVGIDNVNVTCLGGTSFNGSEFGSMNGTSMATPHVAGAAALLLSALPAAAPSIVRSALLDGVDEKPSLSGYTVTGGRLNVKNSLDLLVSTVALTPDPSTATEDTTDATVTVVRSGDLTSAISVNYSTVDGSATAGEDFENSAGALSFAAGETSKAISVPLLDDSSFEGDEAFDVMLQSASTGAVMGTPARTTVTVTDDDPAPQLRFASVDYGAGEAADNVSVTVELDGATSLPMGVDFSTEDATARAGEDYSATSGRLSFAPGETTKTIRVPMTDDTAFESDETFRVHLLRPTGGAVLGNPATTSVSITEDDPAPEVRFTDGELATDETAGSLAVTVERTGDPSLPFEVHFATSDEGATAGVDYEATSGVLSFAAGETSKEIVVPVLDDADFEGAEPFFIQLTAPTGAAVLGTPATTRVTIRPSDVPTIEVSPGGTRVAESDSAATVTIRRGGGQNVPVTVGYALHGGTATADEDFATDAGTVTFAPGETSKDVRVPIVDDSKVEGDETFDLVLSAPSEGAVLGSPTTTTITIAHSDVPVLSFDSDNVVTDEASGDVTVTVSRSGDPDVPLAVNLTVTDGTATAGEDYTAVARTIHFFAGATAQDVTIPITDDPLPEKDENFDLELTSPQGGAAVGDRAGARVTIADNDEEAVVSLASTDRAVAEDVGTLDVLVERSGNTALPVRVGVLTTGTAVVGTDFTLAAATLEFAPGETIKPLSVAIADDALHEAAETVGFSLVADSAGAIAQPVSAQVTISPSDQRPDALISTAKSSGYVGNDIYNSNGSKQTKASKARRTQTRTFYVRLANDGNVTNAFSVQGSAPLAGSSLTYLSGSINVTRAMRSRAGWKVTLRPGQARLVTVRLQVLRTARVRSNKPFTVRATWVGDGNRVDVVKGVAQVVR